MPDNTPNFLKNIEFQEDFLPFKKGTPIEFGGEKEVQNMIEFYLKNKGIENYKENAKRFKINCVLGNNGGGKSRLFSALLGINKITINKDFGGKIVFNKKISSIAYKTEGDNEQTIKGFNISGKTVILDDLYILSQNLHNSVNIDMISQLNSNVHYNKNDLTGNINSYIFYFNLYYFLNKNNINTNFFNKLSKELGDISDFQLILNLHNKRFNSGYLMTNINNYDNIIKLAQLNESYYNILCGKILHLIISDELNQMTFYEDRSNLTLTFLKLLLENNYDSKLKSFIHGIYKKYLKLHEVATERVNRLQKHEKSFFYINENIKNHIKENFGINEKIDHKEFLSLLSKKFNVNYEDTTIIFKKELLYINNNIYEIRNMNLDQNEILLMLSMFDIDFKFNSTGKSFNDMSAGEQLNLSRYANLYNQIYLKSKQDFIVLIDEPDLHLHLDWQRQYIQKLIDVFSTLDPEISLHFIIATHSPFIISDLPTESMIILDGSEKNQYKGKFTEIKNYSEKDTKGKFIHQTFGANYIDIIKNGFFFENKQMLMGSFAQENIEIASKKLKAKLFTETLGINSDNFNEKRTLLDNILAEIGETEIKEFDNYEKRMNEIFDGVENVQNHIGDDFLQDNLMYLN